MTPELRRKRLASDYRQMQRINSDLVNVKGIGDPPEKYLMTIKVKSIVGPQPTYRSTHDVELVLPPRYPLEKPELMMLTRPQPYHPNWFTSGRWCSGDNWSPEESLGYFVLRMIRTLQFDLDITNPKSAANPEARDWWLKNVQRGLFPCDRSVLPDPDHYRLTIKPRARARFAMH